MRRSAIAPMLAVFAVAAVPVLTSAAPAMAMASARTRPAAAATTGLASPAV